MSRRISPWTRICCVLCVPLAGCSNGADETLPPDSPQGGSSAAGSAGQTLGGSGGAATAGSGPAGGRAGAGASGGKSGGSGGTAGTGGTAAGAGGSSAASGSGGTPAGGESGQGGRGGTASAGAGAGGSAGSATAGSSGSAGAAAGSGSGFPYELEFVGNITTGDGVDTDGKTYSRHWDQITPENAGKWGSVQPSAGAGFNWRTLDAIYDYTEDAGIIFKEHAFVWGSQQPSGSLNESDVKEWMTEFCRRYPNTKLIDVVNEPPPHTRPSYADAIGGGTDGSWQWITNSFIWAREACPNAILILNDYSNIEYQRDADHFLDIAKVILAAGAPVDALGAQSHDLDDEGMELETVQGFIERLHAETGLPLYITEMDIDQTDDQAQLRYYQDYFPYFRDSGYVKGLTIWGWIYGKTWSVAPNSGLVRNGQSRPAMTWLMEQLDRPVP